MVDLNTWLFLPPRMLKKSLLVVVSLNCLRLA